MFRRIIRPINLAAASKPQLLFAGAIAGGLAFGIAVVSSAAVYLVSVNSQKRELLKNLSHIASAGAAAVDAGEHAGFISRDQESTFPYLKAVGALEKIRLFNSRARYIYTCIIRGDSIYFVLDPTPPGDRDGDGMDDKAHIMQPYPDAGPACRLALRTGRPTVSDDFYRDRWGVFASAYAPFRDGSGRLAGVVGVDMDAQEFLNHMAEVRRSALLGLVWGALLSLVFGYVIYSALASIREIMIENLRTAGRLAVRNGELIKLRKLQEEKDEQLGMAMAELKEAKDKAEEANLSKSEFLAAMSHEIRTPMNGILGMVELLMESGLNNDQMETAATIQGCSDTLLSLINDILDISKIEAGKVDLDPVPFDLLVATRETMNLVESKAVQKGVELIMEYPQGMRRRVIGDVTRFRQILLNLLSNAIKFTEKGSVCVQFGSPEDSRAETMPKITVKDTGIGIPPEKLGMLFHSYIQADPATYRKYGGTGLGLAICKRLALLMNGEIGVESRLGEGSSFWFSLPFPWDLYDAPKAVIPGSLENVRILGVDDSSAGRRLLEEWLSSWRANFALAAGGEEALRQVREAAAAGRPFQIVIIDMQMPGVNGEALGAAIKADPATQDALLVMLTAGPLKGDGNQMKSLGFGGYLRKPIRPSDLMDVLTILWGARLQGREIPLVTLHTLSELKETRDPEPVSPRRFAFRVLLAEDNVVNQKLAAHSLRKLGCEVDFADNGKDVLEMLGRKSYHLVFMDCQMPVLDGFETTARIRKSPGSVARIPIIAMTASAFKEDRIKCMQAGMDEFIAKPYRSGDFERVLSKWMPGKPA